MSSSDWLPSDDENNNTNNVEKKVSTDHESYKSAAKM